MPRFSIRTREVDGIPQDPPPQGKDLTMARTISPQKLMDALAKANREELVIDAYERVLGHSGGRPFGCDGLYGRILAEFKLDVNLNGPVGIKALAQCACYLRKFVYDGVYKDERLLPPTHLAICDKNQSIVLPSNRFEDFIHMGVDWTRPASSPDPILVEAIGKRFSDTVVLDMTTESGVTAFMAAIDSEDESVLQIITRHNFDSIFMEWKKIFADNKDPQVLALAFLLDLQLQGTKDEASGRVILRCEVPVGERTKFFDVRVPIGKYNEFWSSYLRPPTNEEMASIIERKDRLVVMQLRRTTGEFFTPLPYCSLAHQYLAESIHDEYEGQGPHHSMYDTHNWFDPCCGSGNLTIDCPPNMLGKLFMSTLNQEDIDVIHNSGQNPNAVVFRFDFLNDGEEKFPVELREALVDGKSWIFILNPPYAAGTNMKAATGNGGSEKAGCSDTVVGSHMRELKLGSACQNPMGQFLFRIKEMSEGHSLNTRIGVFSLPMLWAGSGLGEFREFFRKQFSPFGGFCFNCSEFQGTSGAWPVVYTLWETGVVDGDVVVDILDGPDTVTGQKIFAPADQPLSKWVDRPKNTVARPAMNGPLGILEGKGVRADRFVSDGLGYLRSPGNDVQNSISVCNLVSGPHAHGNGWSVIPSNFRDSMVVLAVRKMIEPLMSWLNDRDEFSIPNLTHPDYDQFAIDAITWVLFNRFNQTSSLGNVTYKGQVYDIPNHFFWLSPEEMSEIPSLPRPIWQQCRTAKPRFVASWLKDHEEDLCEDAQHLLHLGKELVRISAPHRMDALPKFQLDRYDAGWYQIRMGLFGKDIPFKPSEGMADLMEEFKVAHKALGDRLRPGIYDLGFLPKETLLN